MNDLQRDEPIVIETGRGRLVLTPWKDGRVSLALWVAGGCLATELPDEQRKRLSKALWYLK